MIRVVVIEDEREMRQALEIEINRAPGLKCVAHFADFPSADRALTAGAPLDPDVIIVDLILPGVDGAEATRIIKVRWPRLKVLIFTGNEDPRRLLGALNAGADGCLLKTASIDQLAEAIRRVYDGGTALSPRVQEAMLALQRRRGMMIPHLSPTERDILDRIDRGQSYKQVADEMGISINTVKTHASHILVKFQAGSLSEAQFKSKQMA